VFDWRKKLNRAGPKTDKPNKEMNIKTDRKYAFFPPLFYRDFFSNGFQVHIAFLAYENPNETQITKPDKFSATRQLEDQLSRVFLLPRRL